MNKLVWLSPGVPRVWPRLRPAHLAAALPKRLAAALPIATTVAAWLVWLSLFSLGAATTGCFWVTTKSEGEQLRKELTIVQGRLATKEKSLDEQIAQLQKVLEDATRLLKRNSADIGVDVESLRSEVRTANGLVTAINNSLTELKQSFDTYRKSADSRLDSIEQRVVQIESGKPTANSSPDELWKLGSAAFEAARYNEAIDILRRLSQTYPTHDRADDAIYFRGQAYSNLKDWDHAIGVYQQLYKEHADSSLADDGLYFAALAAEQLKNCTEARTYLGLIKQKFPKSNVTKQADELDKAIKKDLKNKAKCNA